MIYRLLGIWVYSSIYKHLNDLGEIGSFMVRISGFDKGFVWKEFSFLFIKKIHLLVSHQKEKRKKRIFVGGIYHYSGSGSYYHLFMFTSHQMIKLLFYSLWQPVGLGKIAKLINAGKIDSSELITMKTLKVC